jgi:hypothetical protein
LISVTASRRPTHSSSGSSWQNCSALVGLELHDRGVLGADRAGLAGAVDAAERGVRLGLDAFGERRLRTRAQARDPVAGHELGQIAPVRADVRERPRSAAEIGLDAPVVVLRAQQPVLQVGAVDQADRAALPGAHALARLAHRGVVAVDERDGGDLARIGGRVRDGLRGERVHRDRLLEDHVLAGGQGGFGERHVQMIGRADVDDIDVVGGDHFLGVVVGALGSERRLRAASGLRRRRRDPHERSPRKPGGARMYGTDEPGPCDGNTNTS